MAELTLESKIKELIKEHSKELKTQEEISSFSTTMMKNLLETALGAEINEHLGYGKHSSEGYGSGNSRNGTTKKTLKGDFGEIELETPREKRGNRTIAEAERFTAQLENLPIQGYPPPHH